MTRASHGKAWIALLRGINVGGTGRLPMADLAAILGKLGCVDVRTYVQSGNAVFRHSKAASDVLARRIGEAISKSHGFHPKVLVLGADELAKAAAANPYRKAEGEPQYLHLFFLAGKPDASKGKALDALRAPSESVALVGQVLYLHTPAGLGISRLGARAEKILGVDATARNWRTVQALLQMALPAE